MYVFVLSLYTSLPLGKLYTYNNNKKVYNIFLLFVDKSFERCLFHGDVGILTLMEIGSRCSIKMTFNLIVYFILFLITIIYVLWTVLFSFKYYINILFIFDSMIHGCWFFFYFNINMMFPLTMIYTMYYLNNESQQKPK